MIISNHIHRFLEHELKTKDLRPVDLARSLNIPYSTVYSIIKGTRVNQEIMTLIKIADFFQVTIDEIFHRSKYLPQHFEIRKVTQEEIRTSIKNFLNTKIKEHNITAYTLSKKIGTGETVLFDFIKDNSNKNLLSISTILKLADYFQLSIDRIIGRIITASLGVKP